MKVICDRSALLDGINQVSGVVASRTPRAQLTCVRLSAEKVDGGGQLTLSGTDGELSLSVTLDRVDVEHGGDALVPADKLRQIVGAEDADATLTIEADADSATIRGQDAYFKVLGFPPQDFPTIPTYLDVVRNARSAFEHTAGPLTELIGRTLFCAARENTRYAINGVLFKRDGKRLELVATDGRRLALARAGLAASDKDKGATQCIVPSKALGVLQKVATNDDEPIHIAIADNLAVFALGPDADNPRATLSSTLVEGQFPPYEDVIPRDQDKTIVFDRDVMASAVRRVALLTNEESRGVEFSFNAGEKQLQLSSRAPEMGEARITIDLTEFKGDDITIGFNPHYIADALKVIDEASVTFELRAPNKPGIIRLGNEFLYVVMPVNLP